MAFRKWGGTFGGFPRIPDTGEIALATPCCPADDWSTQALQLTGSSGIAPFVDLGIFPDRPEITFEPSFPNSPFGGDDVIVFEPVFEDGQWKYPQAVYNGALINFSEPWGFSVWFLTEGDFAAWVAFLQFIPFPFEPEDPGCVPSFSAFMGPSGVFPFDDLFQGFIGWSGQNPCGTGRPYSPFQSWHQRDPGGNWGFMLYGMDPCEARAIAAVGMEQPPPAAAPYYFGLSATVGDPDQGHLSDEGSAFRCWEFDLQNPSIEATGNMVSPWPQMYGTSDPNEHTLLAFREGIAANANVRINELTIYDHMPSCDEANAAWHGG